MGIGAVLLLGLASPAIAADPPPSAAALVATFQPAVVNLTITRHAIADTGANIAGQSSVTLRKTQGSGFIIDPAGVIVTNRHTITDATDLIVTLNDTTRLRASVLAVAAHSDLALLKVRAGKVLPALRLGSSATLRPGDPVLIAGNPLGLGSTVTAGIVSALDRVSPESESGSFFQIDAPLNTGNSGGPVFNMAGDVIGISTAFLTAGNEGGSVGLGLAIPSDEVQLVITRLQMHGRDLTGSIGIRVQPVTEDIAAAAGLLSVTGSMVTRAEGPAARAGIESGDIVLTVGQAVAKSPQDLSRMLTASAPGAVVELGIWRAGEHVLIPVTIEELPGDAGTRSVAPESAQIGSGDRLGMVLGAITRDVRTRLGMSADQPGALVEDVKIDSVAWDRGIAAGSVIVKVDRQTVKSPTEAERCIDLARAAGRDWVLLLVKDGDGSRWVALTM